MKIMFLGDTHGDNAFTKSALTFCSENGIDRVVQVGDFGYWPRINAGQNFIHEVAKRSADVGVPLYWLDGNHEDHKVLQGKVPDPVDFVRIADKYARERPIWYIPRGMSWEWEGTRFGAFGGAFSIDRYRRFEDDGRYGWFANEMPDESKIAGLGKVDVLLTHDAPIVPPVMFGRGFKTDATSTLSQNTVLKALKASQATLLVHGHWHVNERYVAAGVAVQGLDCNYSSLYDAAVVFDTETKTLYTIQEWLYGR